MATPKKQLEAYNASMAQNPLYRMMMADYVEEDPFDDDYEDHCEAERAIAGKGFI